MKQANSPNQASSSNPESSNTFLEPVESGGGMLEVASSRASQEVQAAMVVAKKFPRNETLAFNKIMEACKRAQLAEDAVYSFPRGGQTVQGPSIRLAEAMARCWGNIDSGTIELERRNGESTMMAYAWDLETNTRETRIFTVRHVRDTKKGSKDLNDERDVYEMTANLGARRKRACILAIIPGDIADAAVDQCDKTLAGINKSPLEDRRRKMVESFDGLGVTGAMIEKRLNHKLDKISETELVGLGRIFKSIRDGMAPKEAFFDTPTAVEKAEPKSPEKKPETPTSDNDGDLGPQTTPAPVDPLFVETDDPKKALDMVLAMMKRDAVTDAQVVSHAKALKLCSAKVEEVPQLSTASLVKLASQWQVQLPKIRAIAAGS